MRRLKLALESLAVDLLYLVASPLIVLVWLVLSRGLTRPKYRRGLVAKLGHVAIRMDERPSFWIHAVSVGEVQTSVSLVAALAERFPAHDVSISVSTYTGFEVATKRFPGRDVFWAPFDLSFCATRTIHRRRPSALILVELELWPGLLLAARRIGVPAFVVNGRLTERSCARYERLGRLGRWLFSLVDGVGAQNDEYGRRFARLGVAGDRLAVLGNLKHDPPPVARRPSLVTLRERLGWTESDGHVVLVGGSTHRGEERLLCATMATLRDRAPGLRLVLVPRHVERLVAGEIEDWGADRPIVRWSQLQSSPRRLGDEVLVVDTVGELERFYASADMVVVGGSFVERGGHNVFEPTRLGRATCFGPYTGNFRDEVRILLDAGAARQVPDADALETCLAAWLGDAEERRRIGARAAAVVDAQRGARERHVEWLARALRLSIQDAN